jgi:LAO/AO transport system kinase
VLGDRIRLSGREALDRDRLFVRSMSTRSTQAFSQSLRDVEIFLESLFNQVWVETAGSGQTQSEVAYLSGLTVLILQPETGDEIQAMKSGVRELADFFVVNKSDLAGSEAMVQNLIDMGAPAERVLRVSVKQRQGISQLWEALQNLQKNFDWKSKLNRLHLEHARSLFIEQKLAQAQAEFARHAGKLLRSPYLYWEKNRAG